jgi:hypothetical protein
VQINAPPRVQIVAPPRVHFDIEANEELQFNANAAPQLIVESPTKAIYKQALESIADRVKIRLQSAQVPSIAERVAQRRRESSNPVPNNETGKLLKYCQLLRDPNKHKERWTKAGANEFGRLAQGVGGRITGTNTIFFIHKNEIPQDRLKDVIYIRFVASVRTKKEDPYRIRATLGGNLIQYPDDVGTPSADLLLIKILLNSVISTEGAKFATANLSNFYLMTELKQPKYGRVKLADIPEEIIDKYQLHEKVKNGWVYFKVVRGMYSLPQSGSNSHNELEEQLNKEGYFKSPLVPALWKHNK